MVTDIFDFALDSVQGFGAVAVHGGQVEEGVVLLEAVDEDGEALQVDVVVFAVDFLQGGVFFQDGRDGACALESEFLVFDAEDLEGGVFLQAG